MKKLLILFTLFAIKLCAMEQPATTSIHDAVKQKNLAEVQRWLDQGIDINQQDNDGNTPLHKAAYNGHKNVVECLVTHGAHINQQDNYGRTPLHGAVININNDQNVVEYLIAHGANVNQQDTYGIIPLHYAAMVGHHNIVEYLIVHGAHIHQQDRFGRTPLHQAAIDRRQKVVKYLISHGANPLIQDKESKDAIEMCNKKLKKLIVQKRKQYLKSHLRDSWYFRRVLLIPRVTHETTSPLHILPLEIVDIINREIFANELREIREWEQYKEDHPEIVALFNNQ